MVHNTNICLQSGHDAARRQEFAAPPASPITVTGFSAWCRRHRFTACESATLLGLTPEQFEAAMASGDAIDAGDCIFGCEGMTAGKPRGSSR